MKLSKRAEEEFDPEKRALEMMVELRGSELDWLRPAYEDAKRKAKEEEMEEEILASWAIRQRDKIRAAEALLIRLRDHPRWSGLSHAAMLEIDALFNSHRFETRPVARKWGRR